MAPNDLGPAFVVIEQHSAYGKHKMTIPTLEWFPTPITGNLGSFQAHNSVPIDGEVMVNALIDTFLPLFLATSSFDVATVYTKADAASPSRPRAAVAIASPGTSVATTQAKATQHNWMFRDDEYAQAKLVFLDAPIGINFDPTSDISGNADLLALVAEYTALSNGWSTRNGLRPSNFIKITYTLNDKLRKEYGMT